MPATTHLLFDLLAYASAIGATALIMRRGATRYPSPVPRGERLTHYFVLTNGAIAGSLLFGSLNVMLSGQGPAIGKSILGAIVGGIVAVELYKSLRGIRGSTGAVLVPGLALGIFIGRWGCYLGGLDDYTHGVATGTAFGVDAGDGVLRHPVQLYEGFAMLGFAIVAWAGLWRGAAGWWRRGFYYFAVFYGVQRFVWEYLKPYPELVAGLNLFHLLCIGLAAYGASMLTRATEVPDAGRVT